MRKHPAAFHGNAGMPPHLQALAHLHIRAGAHFIEIAGRDAGFDVDVIGPALVNARRICFEGDIDIPDRRQFLEIDDAGLGYVFRFRAGRRDADGQQVPDESPLSEVSAG